MIGKNQQEMSDLNKKTKTKLEASGTTVEALNDAAKMFLTAQQAITLDINSLSVGVEGVSQWFEENTSLIKNQATKFFQPDANAEEGTTTSNNQSTVTTSIEDANQSDPYLGYHQMGKAMAEHYANKENSPNNAVVAPVIPTTSVQNRTTNNLNNQLTSMKDHVNMLNNNLTEAKKKDLELYKEQISLIEAELDAREKKKSQELREKLKHYAQ